MHNSPARTDPGEGAMRRRCSFCDELGGGVNNEFTALYSHCLRSRVWLSSPNFWALPSLGQLQAGHTLIVPRRHVLSMGHLSPALHQELELFRKAVGDALRHRFGVPLWFEHGCTNESS